ncbi:unnamed protein product [Vitrella brassicaformis CCMP3155]|uniref:Uncharacterized protein n=1 Tax=Vitrella brassicaformis (strain CCMP3155) TaxID=1169540 RepID=A0A0G4FD60_VITBC|nr:unnamed protein product [Vitrella brassicaformis CCMP3155]|eukprot:CEM11168.1 unnamed protein product [Vitrella brassicaformis CCMP3155]
MNASLIANMDPDVSVCSRIDWTRRYYKHREALGAIRPSVDNTCPKTLEIGLHEVAGRARAFREHCRQAEINKENRKLVERLFEISRQSHSKQMTLRKGRASPTTDSTAGSPPPASDTNPPEGQREGDSPPPPSLPPPVSPMTASKLESLRTLHEGYRRKKQAAINAENEALVRRIVGSKPTFDIRGLEKDYQMSRKYRDMLMKMHGKQRLGKLPPLVQSRRSHALGRPQPASADEAMTRGMAEDAGEEEVEEARRRSSSVSETAKDGTLLPTVRHQPRASVFYYAGVHAPPQPGSLLDTAKGGTRGAPAAKQKMTAQKPKAAAGRGKAPPPPSGSSLKATQKEGLRATARTPQKAEKLNWTQKDEETQKRGWVAGGGPARKAPPAPPQEPPDESLDAKAKVVHRGDPHATPVAVGEGASESDLQEAVDEANRMPKKKTEEVLLAAVKDEEAAKVSEEQIDDTKVADVLEAEINEEEPPEVTEVTEVKEEVTEVKEEMTEVKEEVKEEVREEVIDVTKEEETAVTDEASNEETPEAEEQVPEETKEEESKEKQGQQQQLEQQQEVEDPYAADKFEEA